MPYRRFIWDEWDKQDVLPPASTFSFSPEITSISTISENNFSKAASVAIAFRNVQQKVRSMVRELDTLEDTLIRKEEKLAKNCHASSITLSKIEDDAVHRATTGEITADQSIARQRQFIHQMEHDMHLLHDKHKALCAASTRIVNQRALDIEGAALRAVAATKHERQQWVATEMQHLTKLAGLKADGIKEEAVRDLEPALHSLLHEHRGDLRHAKLGWSNIRDENLIGLMRKHTCALETHDTILENGNNVSLSAKRELWIEQFNIFSGKLAARVQVAQQKVVFTIDEEQNYNDQEWRNIQHSYNAELCEIRETSAARMSTSAEEHTQIIMDIEESHKTELQLLQKRLEGQMKVSQKALFNDIWQERKFLDKVMLHCIVQRTAEETTMVEGRLKAEAADEALLSQQALQEKRSFIYSNLKGELKITKIVAFDMAKLPKGVPYRDRPLNGIQDGTYREYKQHPNVLGMESGKTITAVPLDHVKESGLYMKDKDAEEFNRSPEALSRLTESLQRVELKAKSCEVRIGDLRRAQNTKAACRLRKVVMARKGAKHFGLKATTVRQKHTETLHDAWKSRKGANLYVKTIEVTKELEASRLDSTLAAEVESVEMRVAAVLGRKENTVESLSAKLEQLHRKNNKRARVLERLRCSIAGSRISRS